MVNGMSPSGKALVFGTSIRGSESLHPSHSTHFIRSWLSAREKWNGANVLSEYSLCYNNSMKMTSAKHDFTSLNVHRGFTIVELLVVIVVIGILAAITIVSYAGISSRATVASLTSSLDNTSKQLKIDQVLNSAYPDTLVAANGGKGIPTSSGTTYQYITDNTTSPQTFCLTATKNNQSYNIDQNGTLLSGGKNLLLNSSPLNDNNAWRYVSGLQDNDTITVQIWGTGSVAIYKDLGYGWAGSVTAVSDYGSISVSVKPWTFDLVHDNGTVLLISNVIGKIKAEKGNSSTCWTPAT